MINFDHYDQDRILLQRQKAYQNSMIVKFLKIALPIITIIILSWLLFISWVRFHSTSVLGDFDIIDNVIPRQINMQKLIMLDYKNDKKAFSIIADSVNANINNQNMLFLHGMNLNIPIKAYNGDINIIADTAKFDVYNNLLDINQPFTMKIRDDTKIDYKSAVINVKKSTLVSNEDSVFTSPKFKIYSKSFNMGDDGKTVIFSGGVFAVIKR
ncbi:hypothetical protein [Candidatus Liberibacter americanus]|uniref:Uncharacterized protein n=1 Tax=Candidatus Liberibacter americanus str. Sao Paulo TaxID=1261131 RepID=U6B6T3_9HYPH|nr:hypothetical protein [Candidatus Liberibacter americanus]AHA27586.1 hypothetical protein lam_213 [Candidatus Liberibacter americanus str. Sao Paulo]EMS36453.1 hypothetical protein G653_00807 [Candidatus Liberibacter americanus PW_SP]